MSAQKQVTKKFKTEEEAEEYFNQITKNDYGYYRESSADRLILGIDEKGKWDYDRVHSYVDYQSRHRAEKYIGPKRTTLFKRSNTALPIFFFVFLMAVSYIDLFTAKTMIPAILYLAYSIPCMFPVLIKKNYEVITMESGEILVIGREDRPAGIDIYRYVNDPAEKLNNHFNCVIENGMIPNKSNA